MATSTFCTHCGGRFGEGKFCISCGTPRDTSDEAAPVVGDTEAAVGGATIGTKTREQGAKSVATTDQAGRATAVKQRAKKRPSASTAASRKRTASTAAGSRKRTASTAAASRRSDEAEQATPPPSSVPPLPPPEPAQVPGRKGLPWLAIGLSSGVVLILVAAVAVVLLLTGGKPARTRSLRAQSTQLTNVLLATHGLYAATRKPSYAALLPAGWQVSASTAMGLSDGLIARSPVDTGATLLIGRIAKPAKTMADQAKVLLKSASSLRGFHEESSGAIRLAGGRSAWLVAFTAKGQSNADYLLRSCNRTFEVAAQLPTSRASLLAARVLVIANTLQGNC